MWATSDVNLISPQQKQGANGEWAVGIWNPAVAAVKIASAMLYMLKMKPQIAPVQRHAVSVGRL